MTSRTSTNPYFELLFPHNSKEGLDEIKLRHLSSPIFLFFFSLFVSFSNKEEEKEGERRTEFLLQSSCHRIGKYFCKEPDNQDFRPWSQCSLCPPLPQILGSTFHGMKAATDNMWASEHSCTSVKLNPQRGLDLAPLLSKKSGRTPAFRKLTLCSRLCHRMHAGDRFHLLTCKSHTCVDIHTHTHTVPQVYVHLHKLSSLLHTVWQFTFSADLWTTWVWTAWVHLYTDIFH